MPGPGIRSPSPNTSATATRSTDRSLTSPSATPTRTSATTSSSSQPSGPDSSPCLRVSEARREGSEAEPAAICAGLPLKGEGELDDQGHAAGLEPDPNDG